MHTSDEWESDVMKGAQRAVRWADGFALHVAETCRAGENTERAYSEPKPEGREVWGELPGIDTELSNLEAWIGAYNNIRTRWASLRDVGAKPETFDQIREKWLWIARGAAERIRARALESAKHREWPIEAMVDLETKWEVSDAPP